ncbi:hypothetical protein L3X38_030160 [Prunus dulcis]|uniref:Alkaline/neutral invertase n=1 Tax=Prunus dulcis TaxID=3755 RepID=A0AAD4V9R3_PRUDU|nr:hypothetical protein L3X38_030160 [Prunus dulcis]
MKKLFSKKQKTVSRSSTEADYRQLAYTAAELSWLRSLFHDLQLPLSRPTIWCDNISSIALASNPLADLFSKGLSSARFKLLVSNLPVVSRAVSLLGDEWEQFSGAITIPSFKLWFYIVPSLLSKINSNALMHIWCQNVKREVSWSYHNGGSWPTLLWLLTTACIRTGRPQTAKRAIEQVEQRLSKEGWPEYYDGKAGRYVRKQARKYKTWSISGYLVAKLMIENPANLSLIPLEEDKKIAKPRLTRSASF